MFRTTTETVGRILWLMFCSPTYTAGECAPGLECKVNPLLPDTAGGRVNAAGIIKVTFRERKHIFELFHEIQRKHWHKKPNKVYRCNCNKMYFNDRLLLAHIVQEMLKTRMI